MTASDDSSGRSPSERIFIEFLSAHPSATPEEFERFCRARPDDALALRKLFESWLEVESLRSAASGSAAPSTVVDAQGTEADTPSWMVDVLRDLSREGDVSLDSGAPDQSSGGKRILERLRRERGDGARYSNHERIARGGMGEVLRVWDENLRRNLAMKVIRHTSGRGPNENRESLERFLEEAQVTGQLEHPGVVPVHEMGLDAEGEVFFTMRLVRGDDLKKILPKVKSGEQGWSVPRALTVLSRACEAVAYAHSKGVIHRDLKPANIMTGRFGEVYVMDWGLARVLTDEDRHDLRVRAEQESDSAQLTRRIETDRAQARVGDPEEALVTMDGTVVGTPCYMPPEQAAAGGAELGPHSDVYSLGAILYHVLTGSLPYVPSGRRVSPHVVLAALLEGPPKPVLELNPSAPTELAAICEKAMAREPSERYASAIELAADIQAYLEHRPVTARRQGLGELVKLAYERNRPVAWTASFASAVLLVAFTVFVIGLTTTLGERNVALAESRELSGVLLARTLLEDLGGLRATRDGLREMDEWVESTVALLDSEPLLRVELEVLPEESPRALELRRALENLAVLESELPRVEEWRRAVPELEARLTAEDARAWEDALASIASSEAYRGMQIELEPIAGLVPLMQNPATGLWEFWHVLSGTRPQVDEFYGDRYLEDADNGIVLVFLPGGPFLFGDDSGRSPTQWRSQVDQWPFFIGRTEVTQAQWSRVMGTQPSMYHAGAAMPAHLNHDHTALPITELHPVESVTWHEAMRFAARIGLQLPREVEWEFACRGGTQSLWWSGDSRHDLAPWMEVDGEERLVILENLRDLEYLGPFKDQGVNVEWNDGYALHAPVASFWPNPFGLFDMHGNVSEWTSTKQRPEEIWHSKSRLRTFMRGGSFEMPPDPKAISAYRHDRAADWLSSSTGLRVSFTLWRP